MSYTSPLSHETWILDVIRVVQGFLWHPAGDWDNQPSNMYPLSLDIRPWSESYEVTQGAETRPWKKSSTSVCEDAAGANAWPLLVVAPMIEGTLTNFSWSNEFLRASCTKSPSITGPHMQIGSRVHPGYGTLILAAMISAIVLVRMQAMASSEEQPTF